VNIPIRLATIKKERGGQMKKKIRWLLFSLLLISAMLLASCGTSETETSTPTTVTSTTTTTTTTTGTTTTTTGAEMVKDSLGRMIEKPQYGGTLYTASSTDVQGFDNAYTYPYLLSTVNCTNEPLVAGDWSKGPAGTGDVTWQILGVTFLQFSKGRIAESWETPDGETIIYRIRKGIHFHNKPPVNGRELDAYDVEFSLKRDFETPGSYCALTYKGADAPISIKATDQWTVEVKCNPGKQGPLFIVCSGYINIFPRDGVAAGGNFKDWKVSNGTGPFLLTSYIPNSTLKYAANPEYWKEDDLIPGNKLPYIGALLNVVIPDESMRVAALKTAKVDYYQGIAWDTAQALHKTNPELLMGSYLPSYSYSIKMALGKGFAWDDINVRYALSMALDRTKIKDTFYGGNATDFTFPIMPYPELKGMYTPLSELPQKVQDLYKYDITKAKKLMADAGQANGFEAEIIVSSASQTQMDLLSYIADMWKDINVTLNVLPMENAVFTSAMNSKSWKHMIFAYCGNSAPYKMNDWRPGNPQNGGNINSPQLVEVYNQLNTLYPLKEAEAMALLKAQTPYILEQCWEITPPLAHVFYFYQPWLKNYHGEITAGYYQSTNCNMYRWIDQKAKDELRR
jgi:peptide/nickel transport system substrate-binding protein